MFNKKKDKPLVGATAKRMAAYAAAKDRKDEEVKANSGNKQEIFGAAAVIYMFSVAFAFLLTRAGVYEVYARDITGNFTIDQLIIGPGVPSIIGDTTFDMVLVSLTRGLALCLAAGVLPFMARTYMRVTDKMQSNPYIVHWGTFVIVPFAWYVISTVVYPLLQELFDIFFG